MPGSRWFQNSLWNGGSVALHCVTSYCSGVGRRWSSASVGLFMTSSIYRAPSRLGLAELGEVQGVGRQQLSARFGDQDVVDDPGAQALLRDEHRRLDRDDHARAEHILAAAVH